jgi:hypothetical protein
MTSRKPQISNRHPLRVLYFSVPSAVKHFKDNINWRKLLSSSSLSSPSSEIIQLLGLK